MSKQNKGQIRRVIEEVYNRGNLGVVDKVAASDLLIHAASEADPATSDRTRDPR